MGSNALLSVGLQRVKEKYAGPRPIHLGIQNLSRVDNDTKRPVQRFINWNENKFLLKDIDTSFACPFFNSRRLALLQSCEEMRGKAVD